MKLLYKTMLTLNSTVFLVVVYCIKEHIVIPILFLNNDVFSCLIYICGNVIFSGLCLWLSQFLSSETIQGGIAEIEMANNSFLPSYLGYFFVALSINDWATLLWVFVIIFIFTFNSQTLYFNPMFLLFNYEFYYVSLQNGMKIFVISKKKIKDIAKIDFTNISRINDYTFIDRK